MALHIRSLAVRAMDIFRGVVLLLAACGPTQSAVDAHCERFGEQCRLREGLLGVCTETGDSECESPPCLACQPQH